MKFLVTGATGFIGKHVCNRLVDEGHEVLALVRNPAKTKGLPTKKIQFLKGDLSLFEQKDLKLPVCDGVIHLAGVITADRLADYKKFNTDAVVHLVEAINRQTWKPKRFLFASSLAAAGPSSRDKPHRETDLLFPIDPYGESKKMAEEFLMTTRFPVTSFRPGIVCGPGDEAFLRFFKIAHAGLGFKLWGKEFTVSQIFVDDLVEAIYQMALDTSSQHKTYYTTHPDPVSQIQLWEALGKALGKKVRVLSVPQSVFFSLMIASTFLSKIFRFKNQLDYKQYKQLVVEGFVCDSSALSRDLGWKAKYDMAQGAKIAADWYRKEGWL